MFKETIGLCNSRNCNAGQARVFVSATRPKATISTKWIYLSLCKMRQEIWCFRVLHRQRRRLSWQYCVICNWHSPRSSQPVVAAGQEVEKEDAWVLLESRGWLPPATPSPSLCRLSTRVAVVLSSSAVITRRCVVFPHKRVCVDHHVRRTACVAPCGAAFRWPLGRTWFRLCNWAMRPAPHYPHHVRRMHGQA